MKTCRAYEFRPSRHTANSMKRLHHTMFGDVWRWAGKYRLKDTNIGVPAHEIREHLQNVYADARTWLNNDFAPLLAFATSKA